MVTTRIASPCSPCGTGSAPRRHHRVDPLKLLALIDRVKAAAGETAAPVPHAKPTQSVKAG